MLLLPPYPVLEAVSSQFAYTINYFACRISPSEIFVNSLHCQIGPFLTIVSAAQITLHAFVIYLMPDEGFIIRK
jgi:hypothetical protein